MPIATPSPCEVIVPSVNSSAWPIVWPYLAAVGARGKRAVGNGVSARVVAGEGLRAPPAARPVRRASAVSGTLLHKQLHGSNQGNSSNQSRGWKAREGSGAHSKSSAMCFSRGSSLSSMSLAAMPVKVASTSSSPVKLYPRFATCDRRWRRERPAGGAESGGAWARARSGAQAGGQNCMVSGARGECGETAAVATARADCSGADYSGACGGSGAHSGSHGCAGGRRGPPSS